MSDDLVRGCLTAALAALVAAEADLCAIDAVAGDGDHGTGVVRGARAAVEAVAATDSMPVGSSLLEVAGDAFADAAGGSSGALYGTVVWTLGARLRMGDPVPQAVVAALDAGRELGGARPGDKTFVDALAPFAERLSARWNEAPLAVVLEEALAAATVGAERTATMTARRGRSAALGERSFGTPDPGAVSTAHILDAVVRTVLDRAGVDG